MSILLWCKLVSADDLDPPMVHSHILLLLTNLFMAQVMPPPGLCRARGEAPRAVGFAGTQPLLRQPQQEAKGPVPKHRSQGVAIAQFGMEWLPRPGEGIG